MATETTIVYTAVYDDEADAVADLEVLEELHDRDLLGRYDAAVIDREDGKPHILKRVDKPAYPSFPSSSEAARCRGRSCTRRRTSWWARGGADRDRRADAREGLRRGDHACREDSQALV